MKNLVLMFLLALLVVVTASSLWRMFAETVTIDGVRPPLVAIGTDPVPPFPPAPPKPPKPAN
jgi:hypothetical protein